MTAAAQANDYRGGVVFDALLDAARRHGGKKPILEDQERNPLSYTDLIRAAFALGRQDRGDDPAGGTGGRHAAVQFSRGRHLLRLAGFRPHAGHAQLHRRTAEHPRRRAARRPQARADLTSLRGTGEAARLGRRARGELLDHLPGRCAQDDRDAGPPPRPAGLPVPSPVAVAPEAQRSSGDPVHLRQLRSAARRGAEPGESGRQRAPDRGPHRARPGLGVLQSPADLPLLRPHRRGAAADPERPQGVPVPQPACTSAPYRR